MKGLMFTVPSISNEEMQQPLASFIRITYGVDLLKLECQESAAEMVRTVWLHSGNWDQTV